MEVHHHPKIQKKNFKEYFLEFIMIFLAVTLGFFAENIREHYTEKTNAKEYLESYRDELLQQQNVFAVYKNLYQKKVVVCDSIKNIFFTRQENNQLPTLARLMLFGVQNIEVPVSTPSYDQMVSSGALRYIHNIQLRDSMAAYRGQLETFKNYNTRVLNGIINNTFEIAKLEDFHDMLSADTSRSYNLLSHTPAIEPFSNLSPQERRSLVFFYEAYVVQAQSDLRRLRVFDASDENLIKMINEELNK
ncbi:MAG TPA: hypothetical protein VHB70_13685 [Parafilimonas sp.]|nr:hypothetical protein [Parafilimonas sp.]